MRVALCLYGLTGAVDFGYGIGKPIDPRIGHYHHLKHIIDPNNADVFKSITTAFDHHLLGIEFLFIEFSSNIICGSIIYFFGLYKSTSKSLNSVLQL